MAGVQTLAQSPACGMDTKEKPATNDADNVAPQRVMYDICTLQYSKMFLTLKEMVLLQEYITYSYPKTRVHTRSLSHLLKRLHSTHLSLQVKHRAKMNIRMRFNVNLSGR